MAGSRSAPASHGAIVLATCSCVLALAACGGGSKSGGASSSAGANGGGAATTSTSSTGAAGTGTGAAGTGTGATSAPSREVAANVVHAGAGAVTATMHAAGHHPRVGRRWPVAILVSSNGRPVRAEVEYEYLFGGAVVAHRSHYRFTGGFHDTFEWPASAVGYPLTFRAVVRSGATTLSLDYPVQVER
jgi:hypothetical protein